MGLLDFMRNGPDTVVINNPLQGKQNAIKNAQIEKQYQQMIKQAKKNSNVANAIALEVRKKNLGANNTNSNITNVTTPLGSSLMPPKPSTTRSILNKPSIPDRIGPLILPLSKFGSKLKQEGQRRLPIGGGKRKTINRRQRRRSTRKQVRNRRS
jgi:hypothetical protein